MTKKSDLENLTEKIKEEIKNENLISVASSEQGLDLDLTLGRGFFNYEHFGVTPNWDNFNVNYFGLFPQAFKTFLDDANEQRIKESAILLAFKEKVALAKKAGTVERYDSRRKETYAQVFNLDEIGQGYEEIERAALFFLDVFRRKVQNQREPAGWYPDFS